MRIIFTSIIFFLFSLRAKSQENYSLGFSLGSGMNFYKNGKNTDANHFKFKNSTSAYIGAKLLKKLDDEHSLSVDLTYARKKIEFEYNLNEPEIPFDNKDITGQKYSCLSLFFGYRRQVYFNNFSTYIEASIGYDYNDNTISSNRGNGETTNYITEPIYYENFFNTNLGEKSFTLSSNFGFGVTFGVKNQFDLGLLINIPFQKIQNKQSDYQYIWNYQGKEYRDSLAYLGKIYYPSIKLTYYVF